MRAGVEQLCEECDPRALSPDELLRVLELDSRHRSFYRLLSIYIVQAYYQDSRVLASLALPDRAPFPEGHAVQEGDWSLLDQVKTRKPFYRPVTGDQLSASTTAVASISTNRGFITSADTPTIVEAG